MQPPPMTYLCRDARCRGWEHCGGGHTSPGEGWATGRPGAHLLTATPRWSPPCAIVADPRWSARGEALDPVTRPPRLGQVTPQIAC